MTTLFRFPLLAVRVRHHCLFFLVLLGVSVSWGAADSDAARYGLISEANYSSRFAGEVQPLWRDRVQRGQFTGVDGLRLSFASVVVPNERAAVVIVSGRTENLLKYQEVVADLVRQNYSVYLYDHRGQGFSERLLKSEPEKGHVRHFDDYVDDLQTFILQEVKRTPHQRLFLLAHSMGGGIATRHLQRYPGIFSAAALSSPMHQPNAKIVFSADSSCEFFRFTAWWRSEAWAGVLPRPYSHTTYDSQSNEYTHSPDRWAKVLEIENEHREVRLGGVTRGWAAESCTASESILADAAKVSAPVLVLQAGEDTAVMPQAQDTFCATLERRPGARCETGKPVRIAGARHELLIESDEYRVRAMTEILDFFGRQP